MRLYEIAFCCAEGDLRGDRFVEYEIYLIFNKSKPYEIAFCANKNLIIINKIIKL